MHVIADLQLHSRFSRAVSKEMTIPNIAAWATRKGIGLVATGDWTHPMWFREIEQYLEEDGSGLLKLKSQDGPLFLLATEVSCIYSQGGKTRRIHSLIWVPSLSSASAINKELTRRGCNLLSDGRPIIGLTSIQVCDVVFGIEPRAIVIPAHVWTPWFAVFGSMSGFDSIEEAFGPYADRIYAIETGLSSNPSMNWRIKDLDNRSIVSFSDAHSGPKLGREATVFDVPALSYENIYQAIKEQHIAYTIEFYPEEGKYHYTGHRVCKVRQTPEETREKGTTCPVCGKSLTVGVMHRVEQLSGRSEEELSISNIQYPISNNTNIRMTKCVVFPDRPPFVMMVPLLEIIAEALGTSTASVKVQAMYFRLTDEVGTEFSILLEKDMESIAHIGGEKIAQAILRVREGKLHIDPGFDGVFGVVKIWGDEEQGIVESGKEQLSLLT